MVFKTHIDHCGWSYGKGDDQYDTESIGSTKAATNSAKFDGKMKENDENGDGRKMCSKQYAEHTGEYEWTKVKANSNRKPKASTTKHTSTDSIIMSIDVELKLDSKGSREAKIVSPARTIRCTVPDTGTGAKKQVKRVGEATKPHKEIKVTTMATNGQSEEQRMITVVGTNNNNNESNQNIENNNDKNNTNMNNNDSSSRNNNNGSNNKGRVNIMVPEDMNTYTFTIAWRPEQKQGQDGKIIIKKLMREMVHRTPQIIFHPTNAAASPVPKDINNINNDFPNTPAKYDDFFDQNRNRDGTNQRTFMKVTMPHDEKELQRKLQNYLYHNKLYMNSPFIDDNTLEQVGFIEKGHSRLVFRPTIEKKIGEGLKEVMKGELLTPQQAAQIKHLSSEIRVECHRGTVRAGPNNHQVVCEAIVLKTPKSQSKIAMELLAMLPDELLGEHYRVIPKSIGNLIGYEYYGRLVADTVTFQDVLRPITLMYCHPSVFEDDYDGVKLQKSTQVKVNKFIMECCGAVSIEETNETKEKGKYIVILPEEKVESARSAIGKMFQEFQHSGGRPAAVACMSAYQNYPLVNDNVTISGHAQKLSEKIRSRYQNKPKTPSKRRPSSASYSYHGEGMNNNTPESYGLPPVPQTIRGIVKSSRNTNYNTNIPVQQWIQPPIVQQQAPASPTRREERTVMSNLSPDDSAKTMMTNVSKMVESLGTVVTTMAKETANTNETMKQMMIQQATTMNNLMMIMTRNEDRRQGTPISISEIQPVIELQQGSTPASTLTNSQYSLSQEQLPSSNKRPKHGLNDDETTAASTAIAVTETYTEEEDGAQAMLEEQSNETDKIQNEDNSVAIDDTMMTDNDNNTTVQQHQAQQQLTTNRITTAIAAGDFSQQFSNKPQCKGTTINNNPAAANNTGNNNNTSAKTDMNTNNE